VAAPTFQLSETNGASSGTVTDNVPQVAYASVDSASTSGLSGSNPIAAGNNSYEKYNRWKLTGVAPNSISAGYVWFNATAPTDSGGSSANLTYKYGVTNTYTQPVATTSTVATTNTTTDTATGTQAFTAPANTLNAYSQYLVTQLQVGSGAAGGNCTFQSAAITFGYTWA